MQSKLQRSPFPCLRSAGVKSMCHHSQLYLEILIQAFRYTGFYSKITFKPNMWQTTMGRKEKIHMYLVVYTTVQTNSHQPTVNPPCSFTKERSQAELNKSILHSVILKENLSHTLMFQRGLPPGSAPHMKNFSSLCWPIHPWVREQYTESSAFISTIRIISFLNSFLFKQTVFDGGTISFYIQLGLLKPTSLTKFTFIQADQQYESGQTHRNFSSNAPFQFNVPLMQLYIKFQNSGNRNPCSKYSQLPTCCSRFLTDYDTEQQ